MPVQHKKLSLATLSKDAASDNDAPAKSRIVRLDATARKTPAPIVQAMRLVARKAYGPKGEWAFDAFDIINAKYHGGRLPTPWIQWGITSHSKAFGCFHRDDELATITLHVSLLGGLEKQRPWGISPADLSPAFAFDVLLHETIHFANLVDHGHQRTGETSHNCDEWVAEINRIAPLLGFHGFIGSRKRFKRIGKTVTRRCDGNVDFDEVFCFPHVTRERLTPGYYRQENAANWRDVPPMPE